MAEEGEIYGNCRCGLFLLMDTHRLSINFPFRWFRLVCGREQLLL
jgi:hypothetical protein